MTPGLKRDERVTAARTQTKDSYERGKRGALQRQTMFMLRYNSEIIGYHDVRAFLLEYICVHICKIYNL